MTRRIDSLLNSADLGPLERSAWVEIDLDQLVANARALANLAAPAALAAVVKADGYGHGPKSPLDALYPVALPGSASPKQVKPTVCVRMDMRGVSSCCIRCLNRCSPGCGTSASM